MVTSSNAKQSQLPLSVPVPVNPKLNKRFYKALVMSVVLGKNRGERIDEEDEFESGPSLPSLRFNHQRRRSFLKHLVYLCDYEKGGDRTTAIALQRTPQCIVYWFASNKSPEKDDKTAAFMKDVLKRLRSVDEKDIKRLEPELFAKAVNFSAKRIMDYAQVMKGDIDFVLKELAPTRSREGTDSY